MGRSSPSQLIRGETSPSLPNAIRVSVNLRFSKKNDPLLPFDVFCAAPGSMPLREVFRKAAKRDPDAGMEKYKLRNEKSVIVLCEDEENNGYVTSDTLCQAITPKKPVRLIFCVAEQKQPLRQASRASTNIIRVNMRLESGEDTSDMLDEDVEIEAPQKWLVSDVWKAVQGWDATFSCHKALCLSTRRPVDGVALRIGLCELVSDVIAIGGKRYIFELEEGLYSDDSESEVDDESSSSELDDEDLSRSSMHQLPKLKLTQRSLGQLRKGQHRK